jgi:(p)ppGpp synthase/HD superfamily hydrolase
MLRGRSAARGVLTATIGWYIVRSSELGVEVAVKLEQALALAERFHDGATDKAGRPYLGHIQRVVAATTTDDEKLAAALHDLLLTYAHWDQEWLFDAGVVDKVRATCPKGHSRRLRD